MKIDFDCIKNKLKELENEINKFQTINNILKEYINNTNDVTYNLKLKIISFGEILSSMIVYEYLKKQMSVELYDVTKLIKNKDSSTSINKYSLNIEGEFYCQDSEIINIKTKLDMCRVIITQGFIASTSDDKICILTRSGSNTSASLIASSLNAVRLEIWTDVSGLYTADPRKISNVKIIPFVNYSVCQEASAMGSHIIHPFSIKPCQEKLIPIYIKNTFKPMDLGTIITNKIDEKNDIHLISSQSDITLFEIESMNMWGAVGISKNIFEMFDEEKIDVNIITTSQFTISTTTNEKNQDKLNNVYQKLKNKYIVNVIKNCSIVSVIASDVKHNKSIQQIHSLIMLKKPFHIIHYGATNLSLSWVVDSDCELELMNLLHSQLII
jgi:aspartate kinase